ncbi:MAG: baeRF3 domain-containing protein [Flavipsychrobacter sp.]
MKFTSEELEVIDAVKYRPAVSIILSADTEIGKEKELQHKLKITADEVKRQLLQSYPEEACEPTLQNLQKAISSIDYETDFKSVAVYVSPILVKVFYLHIPIEEKIIIDQSFEIRDLLYAKQEALKFIILLLTGRHAKTFMVDGDNMVKIKLPISPNIEAYDRDVPQRVANFSDPVKDKEILQNSFLKHIDDGLSELLNMNELPVFLLGTEKILGHFNSISANTNNIAAMIHGNYDEATPIEIQELLKPYIEAWKDEKNKQLLGEINQAIKSKKLEAGVKAIWTAVKEKNCKLLIVEKNFMYPADYTGDLKYIQKHEDSEDAILNIKDAVDDIIEEVIQAGGEVRFVEEGMLEDYIHIVLVRYY